MGKIIRKIFVWCVCFCISTSAWGQNTQKHSLSGVVTSATGEVLGLCSATVERASGGPTVGGVFSGQDGGFVISGIETGDYVFRVTHMAYEEYSQTLRLDHNITLDTIRLSPKAVKIDEVVVKGEFIRRMSNKYTVSMQGNPIAKGKSAYGVLGFLPGVTMHEGLKVNGLNVDRVYLNGRKLKRNDELGGIRAEDIESIEVTPVAGSAYGAQVVGGVIKIRLKKNLENGYYGNVNNNLSVDENGFKSESITGTINYRYKKWSVYDQAGYSYSDNFTERVTDGDYPGSQVRMNTDVANTTGTNTFSNILSLVYDIDEKQSLGGNFSYYGTRSDLSGRSLSETSDYSGSPLEWTSYKSQVNNRTDEYYGVLNYLLDLDEEGSNMNIQVDYTNTPVRNNGCYTYDYTSLVSGDSDLSQTRDMRDMNPDDLFNAEVHFEVMVGNSELDFGGYFASGNTTGKLVYQNYTSGNWVADSGQSDDFTNNGQDFNCYAEYISEIGRFSFNAGLNATWNTTRFTSFKEDTVVNRNYFGIYPDVGIACFFNRQKGTLVNVTYKRALSFPTYNLFNPVVIPLSDHSYSVGNPLLKPDSRHLLQVSYVLRNKWQVYYNYYRIDDVVFPKTFTDASDPLVTYVMPVNAGRQVAHMFGTGYPVKICKWWSMNPQAAFAIMKTSNPDVDYTGNVARLSINNSFSFKGNWGGSLSFRGATGQEEGYYKRTPSYGIDISGYKFLFKNRLLAGVGISSILFKNSDTSGIHNDYYNYQTRTVSPVTSLNFSLSYSFKSGGDKKAKKVDAERKSFGAPLE